MATRPLTRRDFLSNGSRAAGAAVLVAWLGPDAAMAAQEHASTRALSGTLSVFDFGGFTGVPAVMKDIVKAYETLHPNVKIQIVSSPSGMDNTTYTITQFTAGTAPDIVSPAVAQQPWADLTHDWWYELTDWVHAPNPYDAQHRSYSALLQPQYLEQLQLDKRFWSIAVTGQDAMFFYNKDLFAKAGVSALPRTWADFIAAQQKLQKAGIIPIAMDAGDITFGNPYPSIPAIFESMTMSKTLAKMHPGPGLVTLDELVSGIDGGTFSANSPEYQESWRLIKSWSSYFQRGFGAGLGAAFPTPAGHLFLEGKAAMYWAGSYWVPIMESSVPAAHGFAWDVFPFPQITPSSSSFATPGHKGVGVWGAWGAVPWGVSKAAEQRGHLDLVQDFLFFLTSPNKMAAFARDSVYIPLGKGIPIKGNDAVQTTKLGQFSKVMSQPCSLSTAETALGAAFQVQRSKLMTQYLTNQTSLSSATDQVQRALTMAAKQARRWLAVAQKR